MAYELAADTRALTLLLEKIRLPASLQNLQASYANAKPFRHLVIDNMFSPALLDSLLPEIASMERDQWKNVEQDSRERTARMRSAAEMGPAGTNLLSIVHSAGFLYFLSEITGIWQLLPDPYLLGAGYASMRRGDYFNVHSDRNVAYDTGLHRRLAMIIFLNKDWKSEYHGQLELWNEQATSCDVRVDPVFNRTALFEVADPNYHGVPVPLACPADRSRQSFILYYHTAQIESNAEFKPHTSIFAPRLHGTNRLTWRSMLRELSPPVLTRVIRKVTTRDP
jgi:hypothetical protein